MHLDTNFAKYYQPLLTNPENRETLINTVSNIKENIKELGPKTKLRFGPDGTFILETRSGWVRGVAGYLPNMGQSAFSNNFNNLEYWSTQVLAKFHEFTCIRSKALCEDLDAIKDKLEVLINVYKNKPDHIQIIRTTIENINNCIESIKQNYADKYENKIMRAEYLAHIRKKFEKGAIDNADEAFDWAVAEFAGEDLDAFRRCGTESQAFEELRGILVTGVEERLKPQRLAAEIILTRDAQDFSEQFEIIKERLADIKNTRGSLPDKIKDQTQLLRDSGLFNRLFAKLDREERVQAAVKEQRIQSERDRQERNESAKEAAGELALGMSIVYVAGCLPGGSLLGPLAAAGKAYGNSHSQHAIERGTALLFPDEQKPRDADQAPNDTDNRGG